METSDRPRIHYTQLGDVAPGSRHGIEWNCYRREVGRLLEEGHEGRWVLIQGDEIVGIFDSDDEASTEGYNRRPLQSFFIQQIRTWEPLLRQRITYF